MIGVSSSGFTKLAIKKAKELGILLRRLGSVLDEEVRSWGKRTVASVYFIELVRPICEFECTIFSYDIPFGAVVDFLNQRGAVYLAVSQVAQQTTDKFEVGQEADFEVQLDLHQIEGFVGRFPAIQSVKISSGFRYDRVNFALAGARLFESFSDDSLASSKQYDFSDIDIGLIERDGSYVWFIDGTSIELEHDQVPTGEVRLERVEEMSLSGLLLEGWPSQNTTFGLQRLAKLVSPNSF
ncbi:MAG: hypothetical protein RID23_09640 [Roseovarius sp.]